MSKQLKKDEPKAVTVIAVALTVVIIVVFFALLGWLFFEVIKLISYAWHEGAK